MPLLLPNGDKTKVEAYHRHLGAMVCSGPPPHVPVKYYGALVNARKQLVNVGSYVAFLSLDGEVL